MSAFDEARAACIERWGAPIDAATLGTVTFAAWDVDGASVILHSGIDGLRLEASTIREERRWMRPRRHAPDRSAMPTPLPDALDLAAAWLDGRR